MNKIVDGKKKKREVAMWEAEGGKEECNVERKEKEKQDEWKDRLEKDVWGGKQQDKC